MGIRTFAPYVLLQEKISDAEVVAANRRTSLSVHEALRSSSRGPYGLLDGAARSGSLLAGLPGHLEPSLERLIVSLLISSSDATSNIGSIPAFNTQEPKVLSVMDALTEAAKEGGRLTALQALGSGTKTPLRSRIQPSFQKRSTRAATGPLAGSA